VQDLYEALEHAETYRAWLEVAEAIDEQTGARDWRDEDEAPQYDVDALYGSMLAMKRFRADGDAPGMGAHLVEDLYRHLNDLLNPELYDVALAGPKRIVETYLDEAEASLRWLAEAPGVPARIVLEQFVRAWHVFGRSALLLSGGATWGFHHLGVVKALSEHDLLPHIVSGASTGAMIAAGVCNRDDGELADLFANPDLLRLDGLLPVGIRQALRTGSWLDPERLADVLHHNIGDATFAEAFERSGRELAISVSPTRHRQKARLLSHLTSPDVLVTSAVLASSALPGLFPPVQLQRRLPDGHVEDYVPGERWVDGSIAGDLPKRRLSRLHNVNHFIVSQVNPHVVPFVRQHGRKGPWPAVVTAATAAVRSHGAWTTDLLRRVSRASRPVGRLAAAANAVFRQDYRGHIDVHPPFRWSLLRRTISNPTPEGLREFIRAGERATWPKLTLIREQTRIGRVFRESVARLRKAA